MDLFTWTLASVTSTATLTSIVTSFFWRCRCTVWMDLKSLLRLYTVIYWMATHKNYFKKAPSLRDFTLAAIPLGIYVIITTCKYYPDLKEVDGTRNEGNPPWLLGFVYTYHQRHLLIFLTHRIGVQPIWSVKVSFTIDTITDKLLTVTLTHTATVNAVLNPWLMSQEV